MKSSKNLVTILTKFITNFDINDPVSVLEKILSLKIKTKPKQL